MTTYTYTVLDVDRKEIIGFIVASGQQEAIEITRERFPFEAEVGRELAIRPNYDADPYFKDHNATMMEHAQTYSRPTEQEIRLVNSGHGEHLI